MIPPHGAVCTRKPKLQREIARFRRRKVEHFGGSLYFFFFAHPLWGTVSMQVTSKTS